MTAEEYGQIIGHLQTKVDGEKVDIVDLGYTWEGGRFAICPTLLHRQIGTWPPQVGQEFDLLVYQGGGTMYHVKVVEETPDGNFIIENLS